MKLSGILHNKSFNRLAIILNIPFHSRKWRATHADIPFWTLWKTFDKATPDDSDWNRTEVIAALVNLITSVTRSEDFLFYVDDDLRWFLEVMDSNTGPVMVAMFKAWVSATHAFVTPAQVAEATGQSESNWRNRASGQSGYRAIPGCRKIGNVWQIPLTLLQAEGAVGWDYKVEY